MKKLSAFCCVVALSCACVSGAQDAKPAAVSGGTQTTEDVHADEQGLEILSDTQGVDFKPYLKDAMGQIYKQWLTLMPEAAKKKEEKGATLIRVTINPDGTIAAMHLDGSSKDAALDRTAWGAITGVGNFPALPSTFHGPNLVVRIHFLVNQGKCCLAPGNGL